MSVSREIALATVKIEFDASQKYGKKLGWKFSEINEANLSFTVQMTSPIDNEDYIIELLLDNYPEWPPLIEFIHPISKKRGVHKAYPKGKNYGSSFFHNKPCICNPCSRQAYGGFKNVHSDWNLNSWKQNPNVSSLTDLCSILSAIYYRINNRDIYDGRMA